MLLGLPKMIINNDTLVEFKNLIKSITNEFDIYISLDIKVGCFGREQVPEDEHDYDDGDEWIWRDGDTSIEYHLYISGESTDRFSHYDTLEEVLEYVKKYNRKMQLKKLRPKSKIMESQNAIGEREESENEEGN